MKSETFILKLLDKSGSLLEACSIISKNNGNITRLSYNKIVDVHTTFIEVYATDEDITNISKQLEEKNYLYKKSGEPVDMLVVLKILDIPGTVEKILEVFRKHEVNISYVNTQENGTPYQYMKVGILIENAKIIKQILDEVSQFCEITSISYDTNEQVIDNTVFYHNFGNEMKNMLSLNQEETNVVINNSNKILQILEEKNENYFKTFNTIRKFASFTVDYKDDNFKAFIDKKEITNKTTLYIIEPPCGSNTYILNTNDELLFIDCGFACYKDEMVKIFLELFPNFNNMKKDIILTHGDMDHVGIADLFDNIYVSENTFINFKLEKERKNNFREQNPLHEPYIKLDRIISKYNTPDMLKLKIIGNKYDDEPFTKIGEYVFNDIHFDIYESNGGHVKGEIILVDKENKLFFTGDIFVNVKGFSKEQYDFNLLAPYLMTSVNTDSDKSKICRIKIMEKSKDYLLCPGHGKWIYNYDEN